MIKIMKWDVEASVTDVDDVVWSFTGWSHHFIIKIMDGAAPAL
jgi:hypothetical protein